MSRGALVPILLVAVAALAGCSSSTTTGTRGPRVVATTTQLGDVARAIAGDDARVTQILRPNTDPHEYEPRPDDVRATAQARLVLESGSRLDGWIDEVVDKSGSHATVLDVGAAAPYRIPASDGERGDDPHWWHDPRNVVAAARAIGGVLARVDPSHAALFRARAAAYVGRVRALDAAIGRCLSRLPPAARRLVTDHDAFGSFARRYHLTVVGTVIPAQTSTAQANAGDVAALVATIRREHVRAVFSEHAVNARLADAIARETGARTNLVLYGDTLGAAGTPTGTYLGMERANARAIADGLSGGRLRCP